MTGLARKLRASLVAALAVVTLCWSGIAFGEEAKPPAPEPWQEAVARLSRLQALLEYFFMETGTYPPSLAVLDRSYNRDLPEKAPRVEVPTDPATSKPFVYEVSADGRRYRIAPPDPARYGDRSVQLESLDWGWMALLARQKRFEQFALECKYNVELLATQCEMYAKDNGGKFPASVDALVPRYLPRPPVCPVTGWNYTFASNSQMYSIFCPNPEAHGLKRFGYSSEKGMVVEQLPAQPAGGAPRAPGAEPKAPPAGGR